MGNSKAIIKTLSLQFTRSSIIYKPDMMHFFWGGVLSQWAGTPFMSTHNKSFMTFRTAEHYMMYHKARIFEPSKMQAILDCDSPKEAKKIGRHVSGFSDTVWDEHKIGVVYNANYLKFTQNKSAREYLLSTGDKVIVEASPHDKIWGIGMGEHNPRALTPSEWNGQNLLGCILMRVRYEIRGLLEDTL